MKSLFRKLLLPACALLVLFLLFLGVVYFNDLVFMFKKSFSYIINRFENVFRVKIGYLSAFIVIVGSLILVFKKIWSSSHLDGWVCQGRDILKPLINRLRESRVFKSRKIGVPTAILFLLLGVWTASSFDFMLGLSVCALVIIWLVLRFHNHPRGFFFVSVVIIFLFLAPYVFNGQDTHVKIFDTLDAIFPQQKILAESGKAFSFNPDTTIDRYINGLPLNGFLSSGFNILTILLMIFEPFVAYALNKFIMAFIAFFGMNLLLKGFVIKKEEHQWIVIGAALCFALLPFYPPSGLSIAGLPLLFYCFLMLKNNEGKIKHFAFILFFPFYSILSHAGAFIMIYLGIIFLADLLKKRPFNISYFSGLLLLFFGYLFTHFHMIYSFIDPDFISYREEIKVIPLKTRVCWKQTIDNFIFDKTNLYIAQHVFVILSAALAVVTGIFKKVKEINKMLLLLLLIFFNAFLWGFKYWEGIAFLRDKYQLLNSLNFGRFFWLNPFLWYIVFGLSLLIISRIKYGKPLVLFLLVAQVLFMFTGYNWEYRYLLGRKNRMSASLTYRQFYSEALFEKIDQFIQKPREDYRIVCLGIHPGIANYNGFYTLDVYSNIYPLEHKHKFRRIMEKELEKSKDLRRVFDDNGKRCYLLSAEFHNDKRRGLTFARGITKKQGHLKIKKLELNTTALKEMGGEYIFSAVEILNYAETGLSFEKTFDTNDSPWKIYLYKVI